MSEAELDCLLQSHEPAIQSLTTQLHRDMADAFSASLSQDSDHALIFEGFSAFINSRGDFQLDIGEFRWESTTKTAKLQTLEGELAAAIAELTSFKEEMEDIIGLAGDIPEDQVNILQAMVAVSVRERMDSDNRPHTAPQYRGLEQLAVRNHFQINVKPSPDSYRETEHGLVKTLKAFSVSLTAPSQAEIDREVELEFYRQLLRLYKHQFTEKKDGEAVCKFALKEHPLGTPLVFRNPDRVQTGFIQIVDGKCVIEQLRVEYSDGCVFQGREVNGNMYGKGSFRLSGGSTFQGEIVDDTYANGEIIDGNTVVKSEFRLETTASQRSFIRCGQIEISAGGKQIQAGVVHEDRTFTGWMKVQNNVLTGEWDASGQKFTGQVKGPNIYIEGSLINGMLEGKGKTVSNGSKFEGNFLHGKHHGEGTLIQQSTRVTGRWITGQLASGTLVNGSTNYTGSFKNGCPHGTGVLTHPDRKYKGEFARGRFHGSGMLTGKGFSVTGNFAEGKPHGRCSYTQGNVSYEGNMQDGVFSGFGKLTAPNYTYQGWFLSGEKHGKGTQITKDYTYTGDFMHDKFEGTGILKLNDVTYEGPFSGGLMNGYGKLKSTAGVEQSAFFRNGQVVKR